MKGQGAPEWAAKLQRALWRQRKAPGQGGVPLALLQILGPLPWYTMCVLQVMLPKAAEWQRTIAMEFVDILAGQRRVRVPMVSSALHRGGGLGGPAQLVSAWLRDVDDSRFAIVLGRVQTPELRLDMCCRQGAAASPMLWNLLLQGVVEVLKRRWAAPRAASEWAPEASAL